MSVGTGVPTAFEGWLELLERLSELIGSAVPASSRRRSH
jgi:hypothetical protein